MASTIDLLVCLGYFVLVVAIGFFSARKQSTSVSGYFQADNQLPWYAIGFSIVAAGISSEQFVGEMGYAYKLGMPVVNWEWLVLPALSALLWLFVPLYVRSKVATMPEFLQRRFGEKARRLLAALTVGSYVFINFALVFYTGGFALEKVWGLPRLAAVWVLALVTGIYTVYGGLTAMAWTSSFQCVLLLGGGLYVFFAGMARIHWDFAAMIGTGERAHLMTSALHEVPWTALVVLMLSTNVWYYATNQYINQRCLAAKNEWHAKMGVLFSVALQLLMPLATCFPGMIYRVINPNLENPDAAYPMVVAAVAPPGLRGLVLAAILSAIMSTVSGLVNSTSTLVTLDLVRPGIGRSWSEEKLVRIGRWSGAVALLIGAACAPIVMRWENIFRYAQDLWAPMAAPVVVVFLAAALWPGAKERGAVACLWLSILSVPFVLGKSVLADYNIHVVPATLENPMVLAAVFGQIALAFMIALSNKRISFGIAFVAVVFVALSIGTGMASAEAATWLWLVTNLIVTATWLYSRQAPLPDLWDWSMIRSETSTPWYGNLWLWWGSFSAILVGIYWFFW